ncbi:hypothetical protein [Streptomyces sp. STR69]|uniref:hypothetical protein n=1 Tax=Streptomyces sp. STR69 TaxID=1796942 RepID=UPI0021C742A0|nr:hypothetical protein [Streptomyces sp. STR69]
MKPMKRKDSTEFTERTEPLEPLTLLRLLPWPSPDGLPCYLSTDSEDGYLSRLANEMEAAQLALAVDVLGGARKVLDDPMFPYAEVRYVAVRLAECLNDAVRVAESRGARLGPPHSEADDDGGVEDL